MRFSILILGCLSLAAPAASADLPRAIYTDPAPDPAHPAKMLPVEIPNKGQVMNGIVYLPGGAGPFPLVVLGHGLPGDEKSLDLAHALRRAGWAVLTYHYRGSWGSRVDSRLTACWTMPVQ